MYGPLAHTPAVTEDYRIIILMFGPEEQVWSVQEQFKFSAPVGVLQSEDLEPLGNPVFPFAYFLSATGVVLDKDVVHNDHKLSSLIQAGCEKQKKLSA
jgi:hypothetical protein